MDPNDKSTLRQCRMPLLNDLTFCEMRDGLIQVGLFTPKELDKFERSKTPLSRMLDAIEKKGPDALQSFKKSLVFLDKPHLLEMINKVENKQLEFKPTMDHKDWDFQVKKEEPDVEGGSLMEENLQNYHEKIKVLETQLQNSKAECEEFKAETEKLKLQVGNLQKHQEELSSHNFNLNQYVHFLGEVQKSSHEYVYTIANQLEHFKCWQKYLLDHNKYLINEKANVIYENGNLKEQLRQELGKRKVVGEKNECKSSKSKKKKK